MLLISTLPGRGFFSFLLAHFGQFFHFGYIKPQALGDPAAVILVSFVENGALAQLDPLLGASEMPYDIRDQVSTILFAHYMAVQVAGLDKVIVFMGVGCSLNFTGYWEGRLIFRGVMFRAAETVGEVIWRPAEIVVSAHKTVALVIVRFSML